MPQNQYNILATGFAGTDDRERSAYDNSRIDPNKLGVALPFHFTEGPRPQVRVKYKDVEVVCDIVDVGPHNTNDPYWQTEGARPLAESQPGNRAGIDMTPAVFEALGVALSDSAYGLMVVDWEIVD